MASESSAPDRPADTRVLALQEGRGSEVLAELLEVWRASRSARVGEIIEVLPIPERAPLAPGFDRSTERAWRTVAQQDDPADLARLLEVCRSGSPSKLAVRLDGLPDDPRLTTHLLGLLAAPPVTNATGTRLWRTVLRRLSLCGEARARLVLEAYASGDRVFASGREGVAMAQRCSGAAKALPSAEERSIPARFLGLEAHLAGPLTTLRRARRAARAQTLEADLLASVYADPSAPGPRAVYCDWLLERDDPRGRWMSAALHGEAVEPDSTLRNRVLGGLASTVTWATFDRGFVDAVGLLARTDAAKRALGRPEWATVREVHLFPSAEPTPPAYEALLGHPAMTSLAAVRRIRTEAALRLVDVHPIVSLGLVGPVAPSEVRTLLSRAQLDHLELTTLDLTPESLDPSDFRGLRTLSVATNLPVRRWLDAVDPTGVEAVIYRPDRGSTPAELRFVRGADGRLSELEVRPYYSGTRAPIKAFPTWPIVALLNQLGGAVKAFRMARMEDDPLGFTTRSLHTRELEDHEQEAILAAAPI